MSLFAPSPLVFRCGVACGYIISRTSVSATTGAVAVADYWDHAGGVFSTPYDKAKHLKLFTRVGVDSNSADFTKQLASVPVDALSDFKATADVYTVGADGDKADLLIGIHPAEFRAIVGL